jgi:hypothetical protein
MNQIAQSQKATLFLRLNNHAAANDMVTTASRPAHVLISLNGSRSKHP